MLVSEVAELAGTTVRAVRHYHQVGLLPVPDVVGGWRSYDATHLARLVRIRWLSDAGLSLEEIRATLPEGTAPRADLQAALEALDARIAALTKQRELLESIAERAAEGAPLSPLPPAAVRLYDELARRTEGEARRAVIRERSFVEMAYYRGEMPDIAAALFDFSSEEELGDSVASYGHSVTVVSDEEVEAHADLVVSRMRTSLEASISSAATLDPAVVERIYDLYLRVATDPVQQRIGRAVKARVLAELAALSQEQA